MNAPNLPTIVVKWVYKHANKNYWRVAARCELDDLIQDGLLCAYKCANLYGLPGETPTKEQIRIRNRLKNYIGSTEDPINPAHFMRLVQTTFRNFIGNLMREAHKDGMVHELKFADLSSTKSEVDTLDGILSGDYGLQEYAMLISELPLYLKKVVDLYINEPEKLRNLRVKLNETNESLTDRLYKLAGFSKNKDFETELRSWLWEREHEVM